MHAISLTSLRTQLFKMVNQVIETGIPGEIARNGHRLKIVLDETQGKLKNLKPHQSIVGDPEELVKLKVDEWQETKDL